MLNSCYTQDVCCIKCRPIAAIVSIEACFRESRSMGFLACPLSQLYAYSTPTAALSNAFACVIFLFLLGKRRVALNDENVMPVSALANRYEIVPLMNQCEGYMKVCRCSIVHWVHECCIRGFVKARCLAKMCAAKFRAQSCRTLRVGRAYRWSSSAMNMTHLFSRVM